MDMYESGMAFDIRFETWERFQAIVLDPGKYAEEWNRLVTTDCILGGIDYSVDHTYAPFHMKYSMSK